MFHYSILIQFMKGDAPAMDQHMEVIGRAVDYYNAHSRMALNPKEIVSYRLKDSRTLEVVLNSKNELQEATASKALRLFRRDELERFHPTPNHRTGADRCPHSHPCPLRSSG